MRYFEMITNYNLSDIISILPLLCLAEELGQPDNGSEWARSLWRWR